jgi:hypothetical protein
MSTRRLAPLLASLALLVTAAPARADVFGPIELASSGVIEGGIAGAQQALYAHDPAISADGRYVAFDGYLGGFTGVWRRDLGTGEVQPVAVGRVLPGSEECEEPHAPCDAELPSISADGRYVSFTTTAPLEPSEDKNNAPDVYVRDMSIAASAHEIESPAPKPCEESPEPRACAFTIASALNGQAEGLAYVEAPTSIGAVASGRTAISADGREVAFVTTAVSNLAGPNTPADQVAVRDLATRVTRLVSVEIDPATGLPKVPDTPVSATEGSTVFGAVDTGGKALFPFSASRAYELPGALGASISADGTTVAWMGRAVYKQARMLPGEQVASYIEPLWRRIADGPQAPTRRVTGGSEPESAVCTASGESKLPAGVPEQQADPCHGPFAPPPESGASGVYDAGRLNAIPQLSADGHTVAFLATAQLVSLGQDFGLAAGENADLYLVDMRTSATRREALRPLTQLASSAFAGNAPIVDFAISADGKQVALSTQRTQFPLGSPAYVSQPMAAPGMAELFEVDLENNTLTRVTRGYEGSASERPHTEQQSGERRYKRASDGALSPSFSADGSLLAFASTASNLVYGDGNTPPVEPVVGAADGGDVFSVRRQIYTPTPVEGSVSPAPAAPLLSPEWRLGVTERSLPDGRVLLYVTVPGAGRLSAVADSALPAAAAARGRRARARRARRRVAMRALAAASVTATPSAAGLQQLTLALPPRYRAFALRRGGLTATATVTFTAPGEPRLTESIAVSFASHARPARRAGHGSRHRR